MKKLLYLCLFFFGFFCTFLGVPFSNSTTTAFNNTYRTVNFNSGSNILYSYSVKNGKSLKDYDNLLTDGTFSTLNSTFTSSNWVRQYLNDNVYLSGYGSLSPNNNSINIGALLDDPVSTNNTLHIVSNSGFQKAGTYTFSVNIINATYGQHSSVLEFGYINSSGGFTGFSNAQYRFKDISSGVVSNTYTLTEDTDNFAVRLYISFGTTMSIEYFRLEERSYSTPYFSEQYISDLYRISNNLTSSDSVYWSQNAYGQFDFNTPINENINLYGDSELYNLVNFYGEDRQTLLYSTIVPYSSLLSDFIDFDLLKETYIETQVTDTINSDSDIHFLFTDNYYSYENYFNENFYILNNINLYCIPILNNLNYVNDSDFSKFYYINDNANLLNDLSINSIEFSVFQIFPINSDKLVTYEFYQISIPGVPLNEFSYYDFTDNFGNTYFYKLYGYSEGNSFYYDSYLYRINVVNPFNIFFYPLPVTLYENVEYYLDGSSSFYPGNCQYYVEFSIDYNMQYYYAEYFGIGLNPFSNISNLTYTDTQSRSYLLGNYFFNQELELYGINSDLFLNSYIDTFSFTISFEIYNFTHKVPNNYSDIQQNIPSLKFSDSNKIYFFQSNINSNGNNIIPTDSNGLYKNKQNWYDFGTDIYNMFIYLLFDAPIISNITKVIYIIISLIMNVINIIISAFSSVKSSIFIAMILGFLLFKFVIKKFTGGSS